MTSLAGLLRWRSSHGRLCWCGGICRCLPGLIYFWRRGGLFLFRHLRVRPGFAFRPKSAPVSYNKFCFFLSHYFLSLFRFKRNLDFKRHVHYSGFNAV
jgi:hypothetical protein